MFLGLSIVLFVASDGIDSITGGATSDTTSLSITINSPPLIQLKGPGSFTVIESNFTLIMFTFNATDPDGVHDIDNTSAQVIINSTEESVSPANSSCTLLDSTAAGSRFNCSVEFWYFFSPGNWTINATIADNEGIEGYNNTNALEINVLTAMTMYPTALTWSNLGLGATNQTSNNDPIIINNTGNDDIAIDGFSVTAYDLQGLTVDTDFINAVNFSVHARNGTSDCSGDQCFECNSTTLVNNSAVTLHVANMTRGNNSNNYVNGTSGQEALFFCIKNVGPEIARQTYDTSGGSSSAWTIAVS